MILNLEEPTEGRILLEDEPIHGLQGEALRAYRAKVQAVFQDPVVVAQSAHEGRPHHRRIADRQRLGRPGADRRRACASCCCRSGCGPSRPSSTRTSSAAASASAWRWRRRSPRGPADRARRAGVGARRVDPRPDDEPPEGHPGAGQRRLPAGGARSRHGAPHGRPHGGDVSRQDRREGADRSSCSPTSAIPTPGRCSPPCWSPGRASRRRRSSCAARCRRRSIRRPAAASIRAALMSCRAARSRSRLLREVSPGHSVACHLFDNA